MTYNHKTNHSYTPNLEFWRSMETIFNSFPYWTELNKYHSRDFFIVFYETETKESFDVTDNDNDIYNVPISTKWYGNQKITGDPEQDKNLVPPYKCEIKIDHMGKVIKFLSNNISNSEKVHKFQHFLESAYKFLVNILNLDINNQIIKMHGLDDKNDANYARRKEDFIKKYINNERGMIKPNQFNDHFNSACRKHNVPFVMFNQNDECYVVHITDIFVEKVIRDLPKFLSQSNLNQANSFFIEAYRLRDKGEYKDCLAKIREGMESVRDYIYIKYTLSKSGNLHNDMKELFDSHSSIVFDYNKIPENDQNKLKQITDYLRDSILLAVKFGNLGHHTLVNPSLIEENSSLFSLGLIASLLPYLFYILK